MSNNIAAARVDRSGHSRQHATVTLLWRARSWPLWRLSFRLKERRTKKRRRERERQKLQLDYSLISFLLLLFSQKYFPYFLFCSTMAHVITPLDQPSNYKDSQARIDRQKQQDILNKSSTLYVSLSQLPKPFLLHNFLCDFLFIHAFELVPFL